MDDVDLRTPRGIDRSVFARLVGGDWIDRNENLLITGATGLGKSWIACALGHKACRDNRLVQYHRVPRVNARWRICVVFRKGDAHNVEIVDYHKG